LSGRRTVQVAASFALVVGLIAILLVPDWPFGESSAARAADLREIGFAPPLVMAGLWPDLTDQDALRRAEQAVAEASLELERALALNDTDVLDPWIPWTRLYRNLRVMGRWEEALDEAQSFLAYARNRDQQPERFSMYYTALSDVGNLYLALGDYETALSYHQESLAAAREYHEWFELHGRSDDPRPHRLASVLAGGLAPRLWVLSILAAAQGDQPAAWEYHRQAAELLTDFFRKECRFRGLPAAPDASLVELCQTVVADGDAGLESLVVKVREHLLYEARLHRIDRDLEAASETLRLGRTIPDYPFADESRLDFNEPVEELRLAIARGQFAAALAAADRAARHTGPRHFEGYPSHAPVGVLARTELRFLRGVALAGLDPNNPEALCLIQSALDAIHQSADQLPQAQQERFLRRFADWQPVVDWIGTGQLPLSSLPCGTRCFDALAVSPSPNGGEGGTNAVRFFISNSLGDLL
jgi:tetratricopeptide (TPR) repeat protein